MKLKTKLQGKELLYFINGEDRAINFDGTINLLLNNGQSCKVFYKTRETGIKRAFTKIVFNGQEFTLPIEELDIAGLSRDNDMIIVSDEQAAKNLLKNKGYYVDNLWHISHVTRHNVTFSFEQAMNILDSVLSAEHNLQNLNKEIKNTVESTV